MSNPRTHAELIKAWADGAEIEWFDDGAWVSIGYPSFLERNKYCLLYTSDAADE